jgi:endonuclease/exonuclease/phosphatase family metal-dependent hydrolase
MVVKFVSLNIWNGGVLMEELLQFLEKQDADIISLQEVYDGTDQRLPLRYRSLETLLNRLPHSHYSFAADYLERHPSGAVARRGNAILSKFPIRKRDALFFSKSYSEKKTPILGDERLFLVTLPHSLFNSIVAEVVRWNDVIRNVSLKPSLLRVG